MDGVKRFMCDEDRSCEYEVSAIMREDSAGPYVLYSDALAREAELQRDHDNWKLKACEAAEREAALREELASLWETVNNTISKLGIDCVAAQSAPGKPSDVLVAHVDSLKQRLTAAEQRNAVLTEALEDLLNGTGNSPGANKRYAKARAALTNPTESGASE